MNRFHWQRLSLIERVRWLRYAIPPALALVVVIYQLGVAQTLAISYGHVVHYSVEIAFYSLVGPVVTWLTLAWVERGLREKEQLEQEVRARTQQLASLTAASADAILSLDPQGKISSWNRGAERMLGYSAAEVSGEPLSRILPDADELAAQLEDRGVVQDFETTAIRRDDRALTVNLTETRLEGASDPAAASLIIMRDVTARREREAILEEERARIARDLHDGVAQTLYFTALKADMVRQQLKEQSQQQAAELKEIGHKIRNVIRDVRRTIFALRPLDWEEGGFLKALRRFSQDFAEQMGWQLNVAIEESIPAIPPRLEPTLFRVVQESLNNIAKHAEADQVWLNLQEQENGRALLLEVRDDGLGFDPQAAEGGLGVSQMRRRLARFGGTLQLGSGPESGTLLRAELPLTARGNHGR